MIFVHKETYVALDTRVTDVPAWLSDWEPTVYTLTDDGNPIVTYQLYKKDFAEGETVTLGVLGQSSCVNYTIAVTEQKSEPAAVIGDINADGRVTAVDLTLLKRILMEEVK